ncbi:Unknown protein [Striga hermonthica]|uniref:Uncharacterized protein n=1 Tax=Striga hermonthica TaxID=68872 RepID=A0A9N7NHB2_STRHE|nr:Unknown protein [Striga hermonthica]
MTRDAGVAALGGNKVTYLDTHRRLGGGVEGAQLVVNGSVVKRENNITAVEDDFLFKEPGRPVYTTHLTYFNMPDSSL